MKAIIVTQTQFNDIDDKVHQWCVANIAGYNATKWAEELIHPTDGRIAICIEDKAIDALTQNQKDNIVELPADWFPKNII